MAFFSTTSSQYLRSAALLLGGLLTLGACELDKPELEGPVPTAGFTVQLNTTEYPVVATFTNKSDNGFVYQWDFGDGSPLESGANARHTYKRPGTYAVKLIVGGRGGTNVAPQTITIPSICSNNAFSVLTACSASGSTSWTFSDQAGAIKRLSSTGAVLSSSAAPLPACQADDQFSFVSSFAYVYDAAGGTFSGTCGAPRNTTSDFIFRPNGSLGQIVLQGKRAFIGLPDSVVNKTYDIVEATPAKLRLQGTNPDGTKTEVTLMPQLSALDRAKQLLTGGSTRTWVLDDAANAVIVVGPGDADPTGYYPGGPPNSLPACQSDDEFTFTMANQYTYNAKAETFVAGSPGACAAPRSGSTAYTFGPATGAGIAQFELTQAGSFIGVTDGANRIYRIISIDNQTMVLRVGPPSGSVVHTMKLRVK
ncbi:PKD domain-containing protein [Hymenobacter sp. BT175]|uniref:PKD domain-containing protein n=1 Tax=Hymenobacter translucens TaxID=2886507 RepID=UPI001D0E308E|nr:PKD domain-containing protein [Hymenobacter translucens]MCC2545583.1 PKD domain-containing protein [Hymenobacter translucens]